MVISTPSCNGSRKVVDCAFLVEETPESESPRYGVCVTDKYGEIVPSWRSLTTRPSNLVMTGFYTLSPAIFEACDPVQSSDHGECELSDAIDLLDG